MQRIYIKESACIGCHLCEVYCQMAHSTSRDMVKAFKKDSVRAVPRLRVEERGIISLSVGCQHCNDTPCVRACITGALAHDSLNSFVKVDQERCIGCWTCLLVCPFGAIRQDREQKKIVKCDFCQGEEIPVCVANCPNEALVVGPAIQNSLSHN
jgi:anaerobic carbon-monoxide dehydrogenase iron sulfur subunit